MNQAQALLDQAAAERAQAAKAMASAGKAFSKRARNELFARAAEMKHNAQAREREAAEMMRSH